MTDTLLSAACGTYVINLNVIIISERKVITLYIEVILLARCVIRKKNYFSLPVYTLMMSLMMS
jgi:hypothetical protein